jgi:hypothetical protein
MVPMVGIITAMGVNGAGIAEGLRLTNKCPEVQQREIEVVDSIVRHQRSGER